MIQSIIDILQGICIILIVYDNRNLRKSLKEWAEDAIERLDKIYTPKETKTTTKVVKVKHLRPKYHGYKKGQFAKVNKCTSCGLVGLYEDLHYTNCCPDCGGTIEEAHGVARWEIDQLSGIMFWFNQEGQIYE